MSSDPLSYESILNGVSPENLSAAVAASASKEEVRCSSSDPGAYSSPGEHLLERTGQPISSYLPTRMGLKGTVIPRATRLGGSMGYDPHGRPGVVNIVNIDPGGEGATSFPVDLSSLTPGAVRDACGDANYRQVLDIEGIRTEASAAFEKLSSAAARPLAIPAEVEPERLAPPNMPRGTYVVPKSSPGGRQLSPGYRQTPKGRPAPRAAASPVVPVAFPVAAAASAPSVPVEPTYHVGFDIEGVGRLDVAYHHVVHDGDYLVLAYDSRYPSSVRFMPRRSDKILVVDVAELPDVYEVYSAGIRFTLSHLDVCVLLVSAVRPKEE